MIKSNYLNKSTTKIIKKINYFVKQKMCRSGTALLTRSTFIVIRNRMNDMEICFKNVIILLLISYCVCRIIRVKICENIYFPFSQILLNKNKLQFIKYLEKL